MSFLSKVELKKQLSEMGIQVEGNYIKKKDLEKVLAAKPDINQQWAKVYPEFEEIWKEIRDSSVWDKAIEWIKDNPEKARIAWNYLGPKNGYLKALKRIQAVKEEVNKIWAF